MTFMYEPGPYFLEKYRMCKYELPKPFESYRLTDRQTDTTEMYTTPLGEWVIIGES